jgi:PAS domain S-box-containing protein
MPYESTRPNAGPLAQTGELALLALGSLPGTSVVVYDRDLRHTLAAGEALGRHGWETDAIVGRTLYEIVSAERLLVLEPRYRAALDGKTVSFEEASHDGTAVYINQVSPVRDADGAIVGGMVASRDGTEARLAAVALAESERRYRMIAENATDLISRHRADGTFIYASGAARDLLGFEPRDLLGTRFFDRHHPDDLAAELDSWLAVRDGDDTHSIEYRFKRSDGSWVWLETNVRSTIDERTGAVELEAVTRSIEDRKRAERELREAHERFEGAFRDAPVGKALVAVDGRLMKVNRSLCAMLGYDQAELMEKNFQEIIHPDDAVADLEQVERLLAGEIDNYKMEKRYLHADGHAVWVGLSVSLVRGEGGMPRYFIAQVEDVTDRRRDSARREAMLAREREQVERLRELDELKDEFVTFVSHELRTPLTSIRGYVDLIQEDEADLSDEHRSWLGTIQRNSERLGSLVEDLLEYFRIESGRTELRRDLVDITTLVTQAVESAGPAAVRKQLSLTAAFAPAAPVYGDEGRLAQVIDNLVSNAIKYTPEGGQIDVTLELAGDEVVLGVADTGIGIPDEERERLFERFFRASTATENAIPGTGLGLAITKALVEAHGGTIAAAPRNPGTQFLVRFPYAGDAALLEGMNSVPSRKAA